MSNLIPNKLFTKTTLANIFTKFDSGSKEHLNYDDLKVAWCYIYGYKPSSYELKQLFQTESSLSEIKLNKIDFIELMLNKGSKNNFALNDVRQIFYAFDTSCKGFLTLDDFKQVFDTVAPNLPKSSVISCFTYGCLTYDGKMTYRDFEKLMNKFA